MSTTLKEILVKGYYQKGKDNYERGPKITPAVLANELRFIRELLLPIASYSEVQYSRLIDVLVALEKFKEALANDIVQFPNRERSIPKHD